MDLLERTAVLVDIPSLSFEEANLVAMIEAELRRHAHLEVTRVGDNLVARTHLDRTHRVILGGHTDTVAPNGNAGARIEGDVLWGCGAADMKGGLAAMLALAEEPVSAVDVTYVFYAREEVAAVHSGLEELYQLRPDLLEGDIAILGEPTAAAIEAGCQGTLRIEVILAGKRAHTARPWMGNNAIHRLAPLLAAVADFAGREPEVEGCRYREAVQVVAVSGGVAGNVVPDEASVTINHRFAPDRSSAEAEAWLREFLAPYLSDGDALVLDDVAPAARPGLDHPLLRRLADSGIPVRAKLGWTDVARFSVHGVPGVNLGAGDPTLAHTAEERVTRRQLDDTYAALRQVVQEPLNES